MSNDPKLTGMSGKEIAEFETSVLNKIMFPVPPEVKEAGHQILGYVEAHDCFTADGAINIYKALSAVGGGLVTPDQAEKYIFAKADTCLKPGGKISLTNHDRISRLIAHLASPQAAAASKRKRRRSSH